MKFIKEEKGFTLIEMMIVLLIISVMVLIAIPNVTKHANTIDDKACDAYIQMVQGQVEAFRMETLTAPKSLSELEKDYLPDGGEVCPDKKTKLKIENGKVIKDPNPIPDTDGG